VWTVSGSGEVEVSHHKLSLRLALIRQTATINTKFVSAEIKLGAPIMTVKFSQPKITHKIKLNRISLLVFAGFL
jgi:hypothetical protein